MYQKQLNAALKAAKIAGQMALDYAGRQVDVKLKNGERGNPVSEVDLAIDTYLKETLGAQFPEYGWLSEETVDDESRLDKEYCWVVDPIDGTSAYLRWLEDGMPRDAERQCRRQFSVSIALLHNKKAVVGVVYAPLKAQMMSAILGQGVTLNGQAVVRDTSATSLSDMLYLSSVSETNAGLLDFLVGDVRMQPYGSVAYKLALTGVMDNAVTGSVKPKSTWDVAAGALICAEAGVKVTDLDGNAYTYDGSVLHTGVVAAPVGLHSALWYVLQKRKT